MERLFSIKERDSLEHAGNISMEVAQTLWLRIYEKFGACQFAEEVDAKALADDVELKLLAVMIEKKKGKR